MLSGGSYDAVGKFGLDLHMGGVVLQEKKIYGYIVDRPKTLLSSM